MKNVASSPATPRLDDAVVSAKQRLRAQGRAARAALTNAERVTASSAICARLRAYCEASPVETVAVYLATPEEANVDEFIVWLLQRDIRVLAPRDGDFAPLKSLDAVRIGQWRVREPDLALRPTENTEPQFILVPGLLFDRHGGRLGFGGGWYDRALARFPQAHKIGIAFDEQIIEAVPVEPHDVLMNAVITPTTTVAGSKFKVQSQ